MFYTPLLFSASATQYIYRNSSRCACRNWHPAGICSARFNLTLFKIAKDQVFVWKLVLFEERGRCGRNKFCMQISTWRLKQTGIDCMHIGVSHSLFCDHERHIWNVDSLLQQIHANTCKTELIYGVIWKLKLIMGLT